MHYLKVRFKKGAPQSGRVVESGECWVIIAKDGVGARRIVRPSELCFCELFLISFSLKKGTYMKIEG